VDPYDVFLSHATPDKPAVEALARRLQDAGLSPFLDKWHLVPGEPIQEALENALDNSRSCVVCIGPGEIGPWQNEEMRSALEDRVRDRKYRVIPVILPGAKAPTLPRFLRRLLWVDFSGGLDDEDTFNRLLAGIRGQSPGPGAAPGPAAATEDRNQQRREALARHRELIQHKLQTVEGQYYTETRAEEKLRLEHVLDGIRQDLAKVEAELAGFGETPRPPTPPAAKTGPVRYAGRQKLAVCDRLGDSWSRLATLLDIPPHDQARFSQGDEGRRIWEWLEIRGRLRELPGALEDIDRQDLADILNA